MSNEPITLESQQEELRQLQEEQMKLSFLLAQVQALPMPRSVSVAQSVATATTRQTDAQSVVSSDSSTPNPDWTVDMVAEWVRQKGASEDIVKSFIEQEVDGSVLISLSGEDLKNELGVMSFGLRRKLTLAIDKIRTAANF
ncbi:polar growth protein [Physocladia obscura]|uniref:Polar growth protein n=1 Tax=Physocladia obscura TaxID=109957 RepID=A0AAD5STT1_9FUNG|nr:polar growth protein [Physocladia obscura]